MLKLRSATDPAWAARAAAHLDEILVDHAHCERKAAGQAVTLLFQYPDQPALQQPLSELAREELTHFEAVLAELGRRNLAFGRQRASAYGGRLRKAVRRDEPARLLDILLCGALIEARSCERLGLLSDALAADPAEAGLAAFYRGLHRAEARHHGLYVELACAVAPRDVVARRLDDLAEEEARALAEAGGLARIHANVDG